MVGTPFEKSHTPLQKWFYAIYLFTTSKHGVPAKELQRQLGVTYKTAWRMGHEIRKYMGNVDGDNGLSGEVEMDETYVGGRDLRTGRPGKNSKKVPVFGMVERGGNLMTKVVPNARRETLDPIITGAVALGSTVHTDEFHVYKYLGKIGYTHKRVNHSREQWVRGNSHTNTIENFWSRLKNSIRGTHVHVSRKHLQKYLMEFEYRYNMRKATSGQMFDRLVESF